MTDVNMSDAPETPEITNEVVENAPEQVKQEGTAEIKPEQTKDEAKAEAVRKFKLKYEDTEEEVTEEELIQRAQKARGSEKKFQEAAHMRKQAEQLINLLKQDPMKVLSNPTLGHDVKKLMTDYLAKQIEEDMMDPKEKELRDLRQQIKEREDIEKAAKQEEEQKRLQEATQKYMADIQKDIVTALNDSGLPRSETTIKRTAYYLDQAIQKGHKNATAKDVIPLVKEAYLNDIKELFGSSNADVLVQLLGEENVGKIRKFDLERLQKKNEPKKTEPVKKDSQKKDQPRDPNFIRKMLREKDF